jgi:hypothetical protein
VPYFHLVFTLPHALHALIALRPRVIYEVLFGVGSATLTEFGANPRWLGGKLAFCRALSTVFRGKFIATLSEARSSGRPPVAELADEKAWRALRQQLLAHDWVVYAKQPLGGPEQVLEYLGRYTHRVAISNERLVDMDATTVRFRVRATPGKRVLSVPAEEFIDRFLLHVLPSGFKRIRHYGLLAPAAKATRLALARQALSVPEPDPVIKATVEDFLQQVGRVEWARCPHCHEGRFVPTAPIPPLRQATPQSASVRGPP